MGNNQTKDTITNSSALAKSIQTQSLQQNPTPTRPSKIKPLISTKTYWKCSKPSDLPKINKYKPKLLSEIKLTHEDAQEMKARGLRKLRKTLIGTKIACPLTIDIEGPNTKYFQSLLTSTNNWRKLMLCSTANERFLNQEGVSILRKIKRYKNLTNLNIYLGYWEREEEKNLIAKCLERSVRGLIKLKDLDLNSTGGITAVYQGALQGTLVSNASLLAIKYPQSLSSLSLKLKVINAINQHLLSQFISNLQPIKSLEFLNLASEFISTELQPSETQLWEKFFEKTQNLQTLHLTKHIFEPQQIGNGPQAFLDGFHHLKNLRALNIDFLLYAGYGENPCHTFTSTLYSHLASFPHLKSLILSFNTMSGSSYSETPDIFPPLQQLSELEQFCLKFHKLYILNDGLLQKFALSIQHLHNLKDLQLNFSNHEISDETIAALAQSLQNLTRIQILHLYFPYATQYYPSVETLSESITHLPLTSLGLILSRPLNRKTTLQKIGSLWEDPKRLTHFFSALYGFNLLTTLSLDLSIFEVSIPECKHFALALRELQQVASLSLILPTFDSFQNFETLQYVLASIQGMSKLDFLSLSFKGTGLCDRQIRHLTAYLSQYKTVESLELRFKYTEKLSEEVTRKLLGCLRNLSSLKSLKICSDEIFVFGKELTLLKTIKNLDIVQFERYSDSYDLRNPLFTEL